MTGQKEKQKTEEDDLEEGEVKDDDEDVGTDINHPLASNNSNVDSREIDAHESGGSSSSKNFGPSIHHQRRSPNSRVSQPPNQHQPNTNHHRYPPNHWPQMANQPPMYGRGGSGSVGPIPPLKVNAPCRFYSKTRNKCTWGDLCRFEHREDAEFETSPSSSRAQPPTPNPHPHMPPERSFQPYPPRNSPHPGQPPMGYPYDPYYNNNYPPMMPLHSPSMQHQPPSTSSSGGGLNAPPVLGPATSGAGPHAPSSGIVYERKQQLAYEAAPWNDRGGYPPMRYERELPPYPPGGRGSYRYYREPYRREIAPPYGYPNYPSSYKPPMGPQAGPYNRFMSSSHRPLPSDTSRSRSSKRRHDEDESSWSDSGSDDSFLGQSTKANRPVSELDDRGTGTPPGEPFPDDKPETIEALKKLKEIEDLIKKKEEHSG